MTVDKNRYLPAYADLCRKLLEADAKEFGISLETAAASLISRSNNLIFSIRSEDPLEILDVVTSYFLMRGAGSSNDQHQDNLLACISSMANIIQAGKEIKELRERRNETQRKGGIARHSKTREIKGFLMSRWSANQERAKSKRAFARSILPEVRQLATKLGHQFPDDHAALEFIAKSLPKSTAK